MQRALTPRRSLPCQKSGSLTDDLPRWLERASNWLGPPFVAFKPKSDARANYETEEQG
jgi:hypothetical protein